MAEGWELSLIVMYSGDNHKTVTVITHNECFKVWLDVWVWV